MSTRRKSSDRGFSAGNKSDQPFEIKHRIAGAVVLVLVAVVVIPLFLSDPGVEASIAETEKKRVGGREFQSRIVPLNINNANSGSQESAQPSTVVNVGNATVIGDDRPALLDLTQSGGAENPVLAAIPKAAQDSPGSESTESQILESQDQPETPAKTVVMTANDKSEPEKSATKPAKKSEPVAKKPLQVAGIEDDQVVNQGWVVRVGTFSKAANVESVSTLLSSSGFKPKETLVATSLGQSTRVWLGPYAKRETADKISDKLKTLTGEKGYVTKTSS